MHECMICLAMVMHMSMFMCMNPMPIIRKSVLDISQAELAAIAGTTQATVSRWEKGELQPDRAQLARIREAAKSRGLAWDDAWFFEMPLPSPEPERVSG